MAIKRNTLRVDKKVALMRVIEKGKKKLHSHFLVIKYIHTSIIIIKMLLFISTSYPTLLQKRYITKGTGCSLDICYSFHCI